MLRGVASEVGILRCTLEAVADPAYAEGAKAYLKSDLDFLGARMPDVRRVAKAWANGHRDATRAEAVAVAKALWAEPVFDLKILAAVLLELRADDLRPADLAWLRRWVRDSGTWALVDQLAPQAVGPVLARDPALRRRTLQAWAKDESLWVRRAALLAQLVDLRRGEGDWPLWCRLADGMLEETEFFVRKALGWVLRERAAKAPGDVVAFLAPRLGRASGLTLREATRKLAAAHRRRLGLA